MNARDQDKEGIICAAREVLKLAEGASIQEIKRAYRHQALIHHPDKNLYDPALAAEQFKVVKEAYDVLMENAEKVGVQCHFTFFTTELSRSASASQASVGWFVSRDNFGTLDLTQPDFARFCSSRLIFFDIGSSNPAILLPMKDSFRFYDAMMQKLVPLLREGRHWKSTPGNTTEQMVAFIQPHDDTVLQTVLGIVYSSYGIQADLQEMINRRFGFMLTAKHSL